MGLNDSVAKVVGNPPTPRPVPTRPSGEESGEVVVVVGGAVPVHNPAGPPPPSSSGTGAAEKFFPVIHGSSRSARLGNNFGSNLLWQPSNFRRMVFFVGGQRVEERRQVVDCLRPEVCGQQKQSNDPGNNQHNPQYANYWAPLTRKRHVPLHPAQPRHTNHWAPLTQKRHQQEHQPQRPTESSDPTQHAKGRTGGCPGPRTETTTRRHVTRGV